MHACETNSNYDLVLKNSLKFFFTKLLTSFYKIGIESNDFSLIASFHYDIAHDIDFMTT